jgi:hypothetical protein
MQNVYNLDKAISEIKSEIFIENIGYIPSLEISLIYFLKVLFLKKERSFDTLLAKQKMMKKNRGKLNDPKNNR